MSSAVISGPRIAGEIRTWELAFLEENPQIRQKQNVNVPKFLRIFKSKRQIPEVNLISPKVNVEFLKVNLTCFLEMLQRLFGFRSFVFGGSESWGLRKYQRHALFLLKSCRSIQCQLQKRTTWKVLPSSGKPDVAALVRMGDVSQACALFIMSPPISDFCTRWRVK